MNDNAIADYQKRVQSCRERLQFVLEYSGVPSYNALSKRLGLKRAENLYQILKGNNGISSDLALRINRAFPDIGIGWLKSGCGSPYFLQEPKPMPELQPEAGTDMGMRLRMGMERNCIPLYLDLRFLESGEDKTQPDRMVPFPCCLCPDADLLTLCRTDALAPRIMPGAYVLLQKVATGDILYGGIYFLATQSYQFCRIVRQAEAPDRLQLLSSKPDKYGELVIPRSDILCIYRVCGMFQPMRD